MRNLVTLNRGHIVPESLTFPDLHIVDSSFDVVTDSISFALSSEESDILEVQRFSKNGEVSLLASFPIEKCELVSFTHFADSCQLIFVFGNGDIVLASYDSVQPDPDTTIVEIVGSIDNGLLTAKWSPDEEILALLTSDLKLVLISRMFEPITEKVLNPDDIKISDSKHVSVGWGKKETQFKGRGAKAIEREKEALKHAGLEVKEGMPLRDPTVAEIERGTLSSFDLKGAKISWRGDCEYFSVSTIEKVLEEDTQTSYDRRVIRVFNREGNLDSVNEAVDGLEHNLSWKPQGSLIASTQRSIDDEGDEVLDLIFYERNGLRHGQFNTRLDPTSAIIYDLAWSSDSEILAFQLHDKVQLWTSKNYHWYLKQEINLKNQIKFMKFHPEKPLTLMIGTKSSGIYIIDLAYKTATGPTAIGYDYGMTLVVDGSTCNITPLSIANVPPPIAYRELDIASNILDLAVNKSNELYAILTADDEIELASLSLDDMKNGKSPQIFGQIKSNIILNNSEYCKQIAFFADDIVAFIVDGDTYSKVMFYKVSTEPYHMDSMLMTPKVTKIKPSQDYELLGLETMDGSIYVIDKDLEKQLTFKFPQICYDFEVMKSFKDSSWIVFGLSLNGKLFSNGEQIATGVTSLKATESHLLFTNVHSQLCFIHLNSSQDLEYSIYQNNATGEGLDERIRQIERGSIIINCMPSKYSVVLQAPRGNLETIFPRIMVLNAVRKFIRNKNYKDAFFTCRTHRIDLDILHDYDPELFFNNLELFVNQIREVDHLDLFLSCLHDEDVVKSKYKDTLTDSLAKDVEGIDLTERQQAIPTEHENTNKRFVKNKELIAPSSKINKICNGILSILLKPQYFKTYLQTIITAYACEKPPNLEEALKLVGSFDDDAQTELAVTRLCFLQDVNKVYNTALGLYDVKLALSIAQQSQKDPKEYLPFLQNLHVQEPLRKKFLIDDYLKNYEQAMRWLFEMGKGSHKEFDQYMEEHALYKEGLSLYRYDEERFNEILLSFASHLHNTKEYADSALAYEFLNESRYAMENYILAKRWREALSLASESKELVKAAEDLVSSLTADHRYVEAAEIQSYILKDVREAVGLYCKEYHYDDAILLARRENQTELIESVVDELLGEGFGTIAELLADCSGQLKSQLNRLRELRSKKLDDPNLFYGGIDDSDAPDNVSIAPSETSTAPSFFTRYTGKTAGTAKTGASRRTSKNRKREERKKAKGRKGTIYEEEYLVKSVGRLIERLDQTQPDAVRLIEGLLRRNKKEQAYQLQKNWVVLLQELRANIDEIYNISEKDRERYDDNGEIYHIEEIPTPKIKDFPIKGILDY
ncbi:uncharacterized protein PRCAT00004936001 [Priceomyces carsonii]|uniref:uncharacterized protein n=1 Tax=Priceomyces carsonii TaxID=28549 RepID=UPI002EDA4C1D|nr:unnamed protein product [Priceomyces carsonii]